MIGRFWFYATVHCHIQYIIDVFTAFSAVWGTLAAKIGPMLGRCANSPSFKAVRYTHIFISRTTHLCESRLHTYQSVCKCHIWSSPSHMEEMLMLRLQHFVKHAVRRVLLVCPDVCFVLALFLQIKINVLSLCYLLQLFRGLCALLQHMPTGFGW